ncbi:UbiA family prenyltransferase [Mycobacterium sp. 852002-40037_SCH5390672]|uniref:UbiA family prenyltransferase n=1 Tax=Mycobacterium sp. 852002-40037_SCH5390672 TaxID=1834089 RepID=UPI0009EF5865|nr:UbiA family prenyltransferase [Mycobacterium sp. 852002-40037_SCH5390672]
MGILAHSVRIRRPDATPLIVLTIVPAALFSAPSTEALFSANLAVTFVLLLLAYQFGYMVNCLADREADADGHKSVLAESTVALGSKNIIGQLIATSLVGAALGAYLLIRTGHFDLIAIGLVGIALAIEYSLPPLRLKGRGLWQVPALVVTMGLVPCLAVVRSFDAPVDRVCLWGIIGSATAFNGVAVVKTAEDYFEDGAHGVNTFVHALGVRRSLLVASLIILGGGAMVEYMLVNQLGLNIVELLYLVSILAATLATAGLCRKVRDLTPAQAVEVLRARQPRFVVRHCTHLGATILLASLVVFMSRP